MQNAVKVQLETGRVKNVVLYGDANNHPDPPYVVIRFEWPDTLRVFGHFLPGQQVFLREYMRSDLTDLLDRKILTDRNGNRNKVLSLEEGSDIIINNDDGTISMERRFQIPSWIALPGG